MFLDTFRAVLFTCSFSTLAIYAVPLLLFDTGKYATYDHIGDSDDDSDVDEDEEEGSGGVSGGGGGSSSSDEDDDSMNVGNFIDRDVGGLGVSRGIESLQRNTQNGTKNRQNRQNSTSNSNSNTKGESSLKRSSEVILKNYDHLSVDDLLLRLVILLFKSTAVIVAVSIADLPTSFIIEFAAHPSVLDLSMKKQLIYLTAIGLCGVLLFSFIETK